MLKMLEQELIVSEWMKQCSSTGGVDPAEANLSQWRLRLRWRKSRLGEHKSGANGNFKRLADIFDSVSCLLCDSVRCDCYSNTVQCAV